MARLTQLRRALHEELDRALPTDSDLVAFCLDEFPAVHKRFTDGMDRIQKQNILLAEVDPAELRSHLAAFRGPSPAEGPATSPGSRGKERAG